MRPIPLLAVLALLLTAASGPAGASGATIQPGIEVVIDKVPCTLAWILDDVDAGAVYAATAGSCVGGVASVVYHNGTRIGEVAWVSSSLDFALVEIDSARHDDVDGEMLGHPGVPTRVATTADTEPGSVCLFSGHGDGFQLTNVTREKRAGLLTKNDGAKHHCQFPLTPGDNGGPVALLGGLALGVANTFGVTVSCCAVGVPVHVGEQGTSLEDALTEADTAGYDLTLRTA